MSFEIEKKYEVLNYDGVFDKLVQNYGKPKTEIKTGFWWTEAKDPSSLLVELKTHQIQKKNIQLINQIGELTIPEEDFEFVRLRIVNNSRYTLAVKNKSLVNAIEHNIEYEYEITKEIAKELVNFLAQDFYVFHHNQKNTKQFIKENLDLTLSTFNDLKNAYLEVEVTGEDKNKLEIQLEEKLKEFSDYPLREEPRHFNQLSQIENASSLRNKKIRDYSQDAYKTLKSILL